MNYLHGYTKVSALALCLAINFSAQSVHAQAAQTATQLKIVNPRPVADAVDKLVDRYGYVITYEEAPYAYEADLETEPGERLPHPRGGTLTLTVPAPPISVQTMASVLNQLIQVQANRGEGGHFRVIQAGDVFHMVPTEVRDKNGNWIPQTPLLDVPISLPAADYNLAEMPESMIDAICKAVSVAARVKLGQSDNRISKLVDRGPPRFYHFQGDSGPAREVLMRALDSALGSHKTTWQLMHDDMDQYFLIVFSVPDQQHLPVTK